VTALTLHADGPHLLNNLIFGALFGILLSQELGRGLTWFSILLAGAAGNALNAWLHDPDHASVGASTGIFGAIGMLVMLQWRHRERSQHLLRRWTPPIVGAILLGYLGTAGARTDVLAHVVGMLSGVVVGLFYSALPRRRPAGGMQALLGGAALLILLAAWAFALHRPSG
jgi:membrane associated rhomboid family serine protease